MKLGRPPHLFVCRQQVEPNMLSYFDIDKIKKNTDGSVTIPCHRCKAGRLGPVPAWVSVGG